MTRDGELREGLRDLEAAAPGGLTIDDARRALAALRRGGLVLHQLLEDGPAHDGPRSLGFLLGPPLRAPDFERLRDEFERLAAVVVDAAYRARNSATAPVDAALVHSIVASLWDDFAAQHGGRTFGAWLEKHHGFLQVDSDVVSLLRWRP